MTTYPYDSSWQPLFDLYEFDLDDIYSDGEVYPAARENVFRIFTMPVEDIRVVLLGQDPYYANRSQAHGLSFSVPEGIAIPPSLRNVYKELLWEFPERGYKFTHGCLESWFSREKVFLLNCALTVAKGKPSSHMDVWEEFTNDAIKFISEHNPRCVFLLLGAFAKSKATFIKNPNRIVTGVHPSPMAQGFLQSGVFKKVEEKLGETVNWAL
jgi:uracil-DNA glycosylase